MSRVLGFLADVVLLAIFLAAGVAALNVLLQTVVLIVGIIRESQAQGISPEPGRIGRDAKDLVVAVVVMGLAVFAHWGFLRLRKKMLHLFVDASFETFVSKRYLLARGGGKLASLITIVSVLGVAVGTMALIVVISVMDGFDRSLMEKFIGVFAHVEIYPDPRGENRDIPRPVYEEIIARVKKLPHVTGVAPGITHQTIVQANAGASERKEGAFFRGIDPALEGQVTDFDKYVKEGSKIPGNREIIIGRVLATTLGVGIGDHILAIGKLVATANRTAPKTTQLKIVGIFESGLYDVDDKSIYASMKTVQDMLLLGDVASSIHIKVDQPENIDEIVKTIAPQVPPGFYRRTWQEINPEFFAALKIEKITMFIILLLIVLVAALNIIGTQVMTVVQKTADIGILKSMGAPNGAVLRIFLYHGFLVGLLGTALGTVWGLRVCEFVRNDIEKIFRLPPGVYGLNKLPVDVQPEKIIFMAGCALTICVLASIVPAYQAARLNPVEALRHEA
ncbi:lipoprotein-releasing ABC transporter permease subunit [soil metagenome]